MNIHILEEDTSVCTKNILSQCSNFPLEAMNEENLISYQSVYDGSNGKDLNEERIDEGNLNSKFEEHPYTLTMRSQVNDNVKNFTATAETAEVLMASDGTDPSMYCRICATTGFGNLFTIFSREGELWDIAEKICRCLPIIVLPTDQLPLKICFRCLKKLNTSYDLVIMAVNSETSLRAKFLTSPWDDHKLELSDNLEPDCTVKESVDEEPAENELLSSLQICEAVLSENFLENNSNLLTEGGDVKSTENMIVNAKIGNHLAEMHLSCKENGVVEESGKSAVDDEVAENSDSEKTLESDVTLGNRAEMAMFNIYGPVTCDICDKNFTDMNEFDEHISITHFGNNMLLCRLCDESFEESKELLTHKITVHSTDLVSCEGCSDKERGAEDGQMMKDIKEEMLEVEEEQVVEGGEVDAVEEEWVVETPVEFCDSQVSEEDETKLQCKICDKLFKTEYKLKRHYLVHVNRKVACNACGLVCASLYRLILHKQQKHPRDSTEKSHACDGCGKYFATRLLLLIHKKHVCYKYKDRKVFQCNFCDHTFWRDYSLQLHLKIHTNGKNGYSCDCGENFVCYSDLQTHKKSHKKAVSLECVTCHKVFTNETFYKRHRYIHDPEFWDRFKCQTCQRPFRDANALSNHMQLHAGIKPHMCEICGRTYNRYANMLKHRKLHKPPNQWEHNCSHCEAKYERLKDLMTHMENSHMEEVDKGNRPFKWICRFCGKRISTKLSLQDHERIHTGAKPYICEWCGREFRSRPNLLQHHLTHTGDRKHSCDVCGKKFARKSFIAQHMRVHTGEKPFECNICGHRFTQAGDMRRHRRRHVVIKEAEFVLEVHAEKNSNLDVVKDGL